jgi:hypothetical protein
MKSEGFELVLVHVRRGDYVSDSKTNKHHGVLNPLYYQKAILTLKSKCLDKKIKYLLASDDMDWAKENVGNLLPQENIEFLSSSTLPDYEEMMLMKECDHFIIANSSFSWWAAWLGEKDSSIIIAPSKWTRRSEFPNSPVPSRWSVI